MVTDCRCAACGCCKHDHRGWCHEWTAEERDVEQKPSVGRMVHYVSRGSADGVHPPACRAAIINEVTDPAGEAGGGIVNLTVFIPNGTYNHFDVSHVSAEHATGGTWHWPERV